MSSATQSPPRFSRRAKIIIGGAVIVITVLYMFACALLIDTFTQRGAPPSPGPVSPSPTPSGGEPTPAANQPQVAVSANSIVPGAPFTVVGSNWAPNEAVTIFLRDPATPSDPLLFLGTSQADANGLVVVNVNYPTDPRWANVELRSMSSSNRRAPAFTPQSRSGYKPLPATPVSIADAGSHACAAYHRRRPPPRRRACCHGHAPTAHAHAPGLSRLARRILRQYHAGRCAGRRAQRSGRELQLGTQCSGARVCPSITSPCAGRANCLFQPRNPIALCCAPTTACACGSTTR